MGARLSSHTMALCFLLFLIFPTRILSCFYPIYLFFFLFFFFDSIKRFDKPYSVHDSLGNHRWFKLFENGLNSHEYREELRLHFGRWLCREFNARNFDDDRVYHDFIFVLFFF